MLQKWVGNTSHPLFSKQGIVVQAHGTGVTRPLAWHFTPRFAAAFSRLRSETLRPWCRWAIIL